MTEFGEWHKSNRSHTGDVAACLEVAPGYLVAEPDGRRRFILTRPGNPRRPAPLITTPAAVAPQVVLDDARYTAGDQGPEPVPAESGGPLKWVAAHPGDWLASSRNVPAVPLSMERFDPARIQPTGEEHREGLLAGRGTLIRANVRKIQTDAGAWVREFTLALPVLTGNLPLADVTQFQTRLQGLLDDHINGKYRLPRSKDQLHVWVALIPFHSHGEGIHLTATDTSHYADQVNLDLEHSEGVLLHELLHYLGLSDRSHDPSSVFRHSPGSPAVDTGGLMARTDSDAVEEGLRDNYLDRIENVSDSGPLIPDHPRPRTDDTPGRPAFAGHDDGAGGYLELLPASALKIAASPDAIPVHPPSQAPDWWGVDIVPTQPGPYDGHYYSLPFSLSRHLHRLPPPEAGDPYHEAFKAGDLAQVSEMIEADDSEEKTLLINTIISNSGISVIGLTDDRLSELLNDSLLRKYPEIKSYLNRHDKQSTEDENSDIDDWNKETFRLGPERITLYYDSASPGGDLIELIKRAVRLVEAAGFVVPGFVAHLPKYARNLEVRSDVSTGVEELVISSNEEPIFDARAEYFAPNEMIINPELVVQLDADRTTEPNPYGLSSSFDEKAVAVIIHELGHHLHYHKSPNISAHLWNTALRNPNAGETLRHVSRYASEGDSIEEFVAEYFLGIVFEKTYPAQVATYLSDLYRDLGGPIPLYGKSNIDLNIDSGKLATLTARVNTILGVNNRQEVTEQIVAAYDARLSPYTRRLVLRERAFWIAQHLLYE